MVFFQFGNLDFMGSVSGNETKIAPQYKQLMNKLFCATLWDKFRVLTSKSAGCPRKSILVPKDLLSIYLQSLTPCKRCTKLLFVKIDFLVSTSVRNIVKMLFFSWWTGLRFLFSELYYLYSRFLSKEKSILKHILCYWKLIKIYLRLE